MPSSSASRRPQLRARLEALKADGYAMLLDLGAVDYLERTPRFDVVYHLLKLGAEESRRVAEVGTPVRARILCGARREGESLRSVMDLWKSADWAEREVFDLFGIVFEATPICAASRCPTIGKAIRCARIIRCAARRASARRGRAFANKTNVVAGTPPVGTYARSAARTGKRARERARAAR